MVTVSERMEFTAVLAAELSGRSSAETAKLARQLCRFGAMYLRLQETACNRGLDENETIREEGIEKRIRGLCEPYGIVPVFSGDPRGATVKLRVPSGRTDDWGQTGICVPGS